MPDWMVGRTEDLTGIDPYLNFHGKIIGEQVGQILSNLPSVLLRIVSLAKYECRRLRRGVGLACLRNGLDEIRKCGASLAKMLR